jgi:hypothetical protein
VNVGSIRIEITDEAGEVLAQVGCEDGLTGNGPPPDSNSTERRPLPEGPLMSEVGSAPHSSQASAGIFPSW